MNFPEPGVEADIPIWTTKPKKLQQKAKGSSFTLRALPPTLASTELQGESPLGLLVLLQKQRMQPASSACRPLLWRLTGDHWSDQPVQTARAQLERKKMQGLLPRVLRPWWSVFSLVVAQEKRSQPVALPICTAKAVTLSGQVAGLAVSPRLGPQYRVIPAAEPNS